MQTSSSATSRHKTTLAKPVKSRHRHRKRSPCRKSQLAGTVKLICFPHSNLPKRCIGISRHKSSLTAIIFLLVLLVLLFYAVRSKISSAKNIYCRRSQLLPKEPTAPSACIQRLLSSYNHCKAGQNCQAPFFSCLPRSVNVQLIV